MTLKCSTNHASFLKTPWSFSDFGLWSLKSHRNTFRILQKALLELLILMAIMRYLGSIILSCQGRVLNLSSQGTSLLCQSESLDRVSESDSNISESLDCSDIGMLLRNLPVK